MANYKVETAYQLFTRMNNRRPSLQNLYPKLISNFGPLENEVIEILGDISTGKTFIITELIAYSILPRIVDNNIAINGKNAGAIIINTDHHFCVFKLTEIMKCILEKCLNQSTVKFSSCIVEEIIECSLRNLIILNCFDSHQLHSTIINLENIVSCHNQISLIVLDSLSAYYWADRLNGDIKSMNRYQKTILKLIQSKIKHYKTTIIFTKYNGFLSKKEFIEECELLPTLEKVNYRILLEKSSDDNKFIAHITFPNKNTLTKQYVLHKVIEWCD